MGDNGCRGTRLLQIKADETSDHGQPSRFKERRQERIGSEIDLE